MTTYAVQKPIKKFNCAGSVNMHTGGTARKRQLKCELYHDNFQNYKRYNIPKAQLVIADIPYNIGVDAYASNPTWYNDGDNTKGDVVIDPVAGSGSTLRAAYELGRHSYGFEVSKKFYDEAKKKNA